MADAPRDNGGDVALDIYLPATKSVRIVAPDLEADDETAALQQCVATRALPSGLFDALPDELVLHVHSFLDPQTLGRLAQSCRRFYCLSHDLPMWKEVSKRQNWSGSGAQSGGMSRSYYRFLSYRRHEREHQQAAERVAREHRARTRRTHALHALLCGAFARPWEWLTTCMILLFTVFCVMKWDRTIDWAWSTVFVPLYVVLFQVVVAPLSYTLVRHMFDEDFEMELDPSKTCRPLLFNAIFVLPLTSKNARRYAIFFTLLVTLCAFGVLLAVKASIPDAFSWPIVFIPMYIACGFLAVLPLFIEEGLLQECITEDREWVDRVALVPVGLLLLLFSIFLPLQMEETVAWSWHSVMAPLYCLIAYLTILPVALTISSTCCLDEFMNRHSRWSDDQTAFCLLSTGIVVVVFAPLLTFLVLMAQYLDGERDYRYSTMFIPIFISQSILICACCALNIAICLD
eukprot:m51a1_g7738 hypothetical protein (459) ;mRNA; r:198585-200747